MATAATEAVWDQPLDPESDGLILQSRARLQRRLGSRDRWASLAVAGGFLVCATLLLTQTATTRHPPLFAYVALVALYVLAARVEFEVGTGSAVPTQLVLVPMLFVLPLRVVPLCITAGLFAAYLRRTAPFDRGLTLLTSSWHAVGPVLVLLLARGEGLPRWSQWPVYLGALAAQFAFDYAANSLREWIGLGVSPLARVRFMAWVWFVDASLAPIALLVAFSAQGHAYLVLLVLPLVALLRLFSRERTQRIDHAFELGQAYRGTAFLLGDVVEADDAYTGEHSRDVVTLTLAVADRLGLSPRERRDAEFVALLHDVGKIRIPGEIINKPGPLTVDERAVIETHTVEGEEMLTRVGGLLGEIGHLVRSCHERWDGTGYPDGLAGDEIPLVARIVCATDAYSAMTTDRPYRKARSVEEALAELRRCAGTHFDPWVVEAVAASVALPTAA